MFDTIVGNAKKVYYSKTTYFTLQFGFSALSLPTLVLNAPTGILLTALSMGSNLRYLYCRNVEVYNQSKENIDESRQLFQKISLNSAEALWKLLKKLNLQETDIGVVREILKTSGLQVANGEQDIDNIFQLFCHLELGPGEGKGKAKTKTFDSPNKAKAVQLLEKLDSNLVNEKGDYNLPEVLNKLKDLPINVNSDLLLQSLKASIIIHWISFLCAVTSAGIVINTQATNDTSDSDGFPYYAFGAAALGATSLCLSGFFHNKKAQSLRRQQTTIEKQLKQLEHLKEIVDTEVVKEANFVKIA